MASLMGGPDPPLDALRIIGGRKRTVITRKPRPSTTPTSELCLRERQSSQIVRSIASSRTQFFLRVFRQPTFRDEQECQNPSATDVRGPTIEALERMVRSRG
jgi:hypothetical protein